MDIFVLNSLLMVSLSVFRLSARVHRRSFGILNLTQPVRTQDGPLCEFVTFIDKDMTVNWKFLRWGRTRMCQSAWQGKPLF